MSEWQTMDTAPKDGTTILIHNPHWADGTVHPAKWFDDPSGLGCDWQTIDGWWSDGCDDSPTHWMPLPDAPVKE